MDAFVERTLPVGSGRFDPLSGELALGGLTVMLRPRSAAVLAHLVRNRDRMVSKDELMQAVWPDAVVTEDSIFQCVKEIRRALGDSRRHWIRTLPRHGYAFIAPPPAAPDAEPAPDLVHPAGGAAAVRWHAARLGSTRWLRLAAFGVAAIAVVAMGLPGWRGNGREASMAPPLSMVVMPIANMTGDPAREHAADDITEALADALSRAAGTSVIASSTAFTFKGAAVDVRRIGTELNVRYLLQGSLRLDGAHPVLTMRLADAATGLQLWNQEFRTAAMRDLRELVVGRVADTLGLQLVRADARRSAEPPLPPPHVAALVSRARATLRTSGGAGEGVLAARSLLEDALREERNLPEAIALLASTYLMDVRFSGEREDRLRRAAAVVERGLALAPDSDAVRVAEGRLRYEQRRMPQALAAFERAIELNPGSATALAFRGSALVMLGRPDEALAPIERAMQLSPRDEQLALWQTVRGVAHLHLGQDAAAIEWLSRGVQNSSGGAMAHLFLASAYGLSGRTVEAQQHLAASQRARPGLTLSRFREVEPSDAPAFRAQRERVYEGLRRAGMPD